MPTETNITRWIGYLYRGAKKFGESGFDKRLRELCGFGQENNHTQVKNAIFAEITNYYHVSRKTLLKSTKRGSVAEARTMAIILFHHHLCLTKAEIGHIFGRSYKLIGMRVRAFEAVIGEAERHPMTEGGQLLEKMYANKSFMDNYNAINEKICQLKGKLAAKNKQ